MIIAGQKVVQLDSDKNWSFPRSCFCMVLFFLFLLLVVLEGAFSGSFDYGRMKVKFSIAWLQWRYLFQPKWPMMMRFFRKTGAILDLYTPVLRGDVFFEDWGCDFKRVNREISGSMLIWTYDCFHKERWYGKTVVRRVRKNKEPKEGQPFCFVV